VQATVRLFDPATRSGTVVLDDGIELPFDRPSFDASGLRLLRVGQRVRIELVAGPDGRRVTSLTVATLPDPRR
jgi:2-phospho-L-lactate guanylyltransferase